MTKARWNLLSAGRCTRQITAATTSLNSPPAIFFGLARNHAFVDGNKRIAIVTAGVFLLENGYEIETTDANLYAFVLAVAAGEIDEEGATRFLRDFSLPLSPSP